jgi:DNA-binding NarL/FixJ family response regulator
MDWYPWMHFFYMAESLAHAGRFKEAADISGAQYQAGVEEHSIEAQAMFSWQISKPVADRGNVEEAVRRASTAVALYRQLGRPQFVEFCLIYLATAHAIGGRAREAEEALRRHDQLGLERGWFMGVDLELARAWTAAAAGDLSKAAELFMDAATSGEKIGDLVGAAAALHALARIGHAKAGHGRLRELADSTEGELVPARAAHAEALVLRDAAALDDACSTFDLLGADLLAAEAAIDAAVAWRKLGDHRAAAASERRSQWLAARCEGASTPALRGTEARVRLTAAEWEATALAANGLSNKQIAEQLFLSVRTVENRLQQAYSKLGINSRAELANALEMMRGTQD